MFRCKGKVLPTHFGGHIFPFGNWKKILVASWPQNLCSRSSKNSSSVSKLKTWNLILYPWKSKLKTRASKLNSQKLRVSRENLGPWYSLESSFGFSEALEGISGKWANAEMCKRNKFPASVKCGDYNMKYEISTINWDLNFDINTAPYCTPYIRENTPNLMWQNTGRLKQYGCLTTRRGASKHFIACNQRVLWYSTKDFWSTYIGFNSILERMLYLPQPSHACRQLTSSVECFLAFQFLKEKHHAFISIWISQCIALPAHNWSKPFQTYNSWVKC